VHVFFFVLKSLWWTPGHGFVLFPYRSISIQDPAASVDLPRPYLAAASHGQRHSHRAVTCEVESEGALDFPALARRAKFANFLIKISAP